MGEPKYYIAWNGTVRKWKYTDEERVKKYASCYDCGRFYRNLGDCTLSDELWERINPTDHKGAGILCANCINDRLRHLGLTPTNVTLW